MKNPMEMIQRDPGRQQSGGGAENFVLENISIWEKKTFYERLGVTNNATEDEIKLAFKKLSIKYHPDKVSSNEKLRVNYQEVQKLLGEAKSTLTNPTAKAKYDMKFGRSSFSGSGSQSTYQRRPHSWSEAKEQYSSQKSQEPKKEFNEAEEIKNFSNYVKENVDNHYEVPRIKKKLDDLVNHGVKKENLIIVIEKYVIDHFVQYTKQNIDNNYEIPMIKKLMADFAELGINKDKLLKSIEGILVTQMKTYTKQNIDNNYELPRIKKLMADLENFGVDREKFTTAIELTVIEHFARYTKQNIDNNYEIPRIKKLMEDLPGLGVTKYKLSESIQDIAINYFESYSKKNFDNRYEIPRIKKLMVDLTDMGINKNRLTEIAKKYNIN